MTLFVLDPSKLPGAPETLPKGWGANDWDCPEGVDVLDAIRCGVIRPDVADPVALVSIDPTYPNNIELPPAIIALEPDRGIPLPAGEVGLLAGQRGGTEVDPYHPDGHRGRGGRGWHARVPVYGPRSPR